MKMIMMVMARLLVSPFQVFLFSWKGSVSPRKMPRLEYGSFSKCTQTRHYGTWLIA